MDRKLKDDAYRDLIKRATAMLVRSYVPYSKFHVGAALMCKDGSIETGVNIENSSYSPAICAERTAIFKAVSEGKREFEAIAVVGCKEEHLSTEEYKNGILPDYCPPCGVCRQVMREFTDPLDFEIILAKSEDDYKVYKLCELLPESFGPENLGV